jgi:hypothetical protein
VVGINLEKFFDRVHHDTHLPMVKRKVADRKVLTPINRINTVGGVSLCFVSSTPPFILPKRYFS